jgi:hypothetical protein
MKAAKLCSVLFIALALVLSVGPARASLTITSSNSQANIDLTPVTAGDPGRVGMDSWTVDGVSELYQQWFWYRIGDNGGEKSIDNLNLIGSGTGIGIGQAEVNEAFVDYGPVGAAGRPNGLEILITYTLSGGAPGSGTADIGEVLKISNHSTSSMSVHFFQYSDFDLGSMFSNQSVAITGSPANTATQTSPHGVLSETNVDRNPDHVEAAGFSVIRDSLNDTSPTTLNDDKNFGPGDATWAFEWDLTIGAGSSVNFSKDKSIRTVVPEPTTILGLGVVLLAVGRKLRKRLV